MPKDIFCDSFVTLWYILINKVKAITLVNTCATGYSIIDNDIVETVCQILKIEL